MALHHMCVILLFFVFENLRLLLQDSRLAAFWESQEHLARARVAQELAHSRSVPGLLQATWPEVKWASV